VDRVFLDANILYAAAFKLTSPLRRLWELADVELCTCEHAAGEALGNLGEDRPSQLGELQRLLSSVKVRNYVGPERSVPEAIELVAKDRPILAGAIRARATHLLTGDKAHFGSCFGRRLGGVLILPPSDYLRSRASR